MIPDLGKIRNLFFVFRAAEVIIVVEPKTEK